MVLSAKQLSPHLVLATKIDDDIFKREASLLAQACQHVLDELAITRGGQGGTAIRQVDAAVTPQATPTLFRGAGTRPAILQQKREERKEE